MSRYIIDGIEYVSPTEIIGLVSNKEALMQWAVNLVLDFTKNESQKLNAVELKKEIENILLTARFKHKEKRDETCDIGHESHSLIESFINMKIKNGNEEEFLNYAGKQNALIKQMFYQFYGWQKKNIKRFILAESQVVHEEYCYAGTFDLIWQDYKDLIHLTDIKTKNMLYGEEKMQIAAYKKAYESMTKDTYKITNNLNGQTWTTTLKHIPLKIDKIDILKIARDYFEPIELKDFSDNFAYNFLAFCGLLDYFYFFAKRRMNNKRCIIKETK